jgi:hypothetical protein
MLLPTKKWLIWSFLKISTLLDFVTKLISKPQKNLLENTNKEATDRTAIHMKYLSKFLNNIIMQKNNLFSLI